MGQTESLTTTAAVSHRDQTRNIILVGINTGLCYLGAPLLYSDLNHSSLCKGLQESLTIANLPSSAYLVMSIAPVFVGWLFPQVRRLRPIMAGCYGILAVMGLMVAASLLLPVPNWLRVALVIGHGAVLGGTRTTAVACEFEVLGRAVDEARRGTALALAYGAGPALAVAGSLASQMLLGKVGSFLVGYAALFAACTPLMLLAAFLSTLYVLPVPAQEPCRQPFLSGVFGGLDRFVGSRVVRLAALIGIVVASGLTVFSNMSLYTEQILHVEPFRVTGYQNTWRYAFKAIGGLFFGWLLARSTPRTLVVVTSLVGLAGVVWVTATSAHTFMVSFGLVGAGQLSGIYITNYILGCSPPALMRRYMAFTMVTMVPAAAAGAFFGWIVDTFGTSDRAFGFRLSFVASMVFFAVGIAMALLLPARPRPEGERIEDRPQQVQEEGKEIHRETAG